MRARENAGTARHLTRVCPERFGAGNGRRPQVLLQVVRRAVDLHHGPVPAAQQDLTPVPGPVPGSALHVVGVPRAIRDQLIARGLFPVELDPRVWTPGLAGILCDRVADKFKAARAKPVQKALFDQVTESVLNGPPAGYAAGVARV